MPQKKPHGIFYCFLPIIYFYAINFLVGVAFAFIISLTPQSLEDPVKIIEMYAPTIQIVSYIMMITVFCCIFVLNERKRYDRIKRTVFAPKDFFALLFLGMGLFLLTNVFITILSSFEIFQDAIQSHNSVMQMFDEENLFMLLLFSAVLAPISEELLFRGLIFNRFRDISTEKHALLSSALLFGCMHIGSLIQAVYAFVIGYIFAYTYTKYENILVPIFLHMVFNATNFLFLSNQAETFFSTTFGMCLFYFAAVLLSTLGYKFIKNKSYPEPKI